MKENVQRIGKRFLSDVKRDDVSGLAAELAYRFLFAIFPFGIFVAALTAFIAPVLGFQDPTGQILGAIGDNLPADIAAGVRPQLEAVLGTTRPGLLSLGALAALWAATGGTNALIKAMNRAYEVEETRPLIPRYALVIGLTLLASVGLLAAFVTIVGASFLTSEVVETLRLDPGVVGAVSALRWPAVFVGLSVAVGVLYKLAPNFRAPWRWALAGGAIFSVAWLVATAGFGLYVANFGNYSNTYGALGGVIVLMLWFYLSSMVLVGAAALVASAMKEMQPETFAAGKAAAEAAAKEAARTQGRSVEAVRGMGSATMSGLGASISSEAQAPAAASSDAPAAAAPATAAASDSRPGAIRRWHAASHRQEQAGLLGWAVTGAAIAAGVAVGMLAGRILDREER